MTTVSDVLFHVHHGQSEGGVLCFVSTVRSIVHGYPTMLYYLCALFERYTLIRGSGATLCLMLGESEVSVGLLFLEGTTGNIDPKSGQWPFASWSEEVQREHREACNGLRVFAL